LYKNFYNFGQISPHDFRKSFRGLRLGQRHTECLMEGCRKAARTSRGTRMTEEMVQ